MICIITGFLAQPKCGKFGVTYTLPVPGIIQQELKYCEILNKIHIFLFNIKYK